MEIWGVREGRVEVRDRNVLRAGRRAVALDTRIKRFWSMVAGFVWFLPLGAGVEGFSAAIAVPFATVSPFVSCVAGVKGSHIGCVSDAHSGGSLSMAANSLSICA